MILKKADLLFVTIIILLSTFVTGSEAYGMTRRIFGVVTDSITGEPLPFANIQSTKDNKGNIIADEKGMFRLLITDEGEGWTVSYMGYKPYPLPLFVSDTTINLRLAPVTKDLNEVIVKRQKERYSKRNNPAVDFMTRLRRESRLHDPLKEDDYSFDKYEKTVLAWNDFNSDFQKGFLSKGGKFLQNYIDTSDCTGQRILDLIIKEKFSTQIKSRDPAAKKEIIRGYRSAGIDEMVTQQNMQVLLEDVIREVDIFGNDIIMLQNRFVSPLSAIGADFYKYYLTDTVYIGQDKCIELSFAPRNPESMGFNGKIFVIADDSTMSVKKVTMRVPHDINLNYVDDLYITQNFETDSIGNRRKIYDDVCIEMQIMPGTPRLYARKTTVYDNFSYEKREDLDEYYRKLGINLYEEGYDKREESFWNEHRSLPMSAAEERMGMLMHEMRKNKFLYWTEKVISLMESGYVRTGNPSKFDFGPLNTLISANSVEGARFRIGGMTMSALNPHLFAKGYVAYGTKDRKIKYDAMLEYSFAKKKRHSYEWPRHGFFVSYQYDLDMIGQHYLFTNPDNIFLSLKRKESILVTYRRNLKAGYVLELPNNFSVEAAFDHQRQIPTKWLPFITTSGTELPYYDQSSFNITLRWAPVEKFVQGRSIRVPVNMDAWIFQLTHEYGPKKLAGAAFTLNRSELSIQKRLWMSAFGYMDIILKGGKVWSGVYYPALLWPNANLSYTIQPESYSLMNAMEFANDRYLALDFTYFGNGILFNRIPLIKKLKMREAFTFKGLCGGLSDRNNPEKTEGLLQFPVDSHSRIMNRTPYMEIGVGLDNILTFLRVDYLWRLTYLDTPDIDHNGVRISLHFTF